MLKLKNKLIIFSLIILFSACEEVYNPKPKAYLRLAFPEKVYIPFNSNCPYSFQAPNYSIMLKQDKHKDYYCWYDLSFLPFNGDLHLSYKALDNNLAEYIEDARNLTYKHAIKANNIIETPINRDSAKVYGIVYELKGNTASALQFFLTDSSEHFLRGALYFRASPNSDSIAPVLNFVKQDIDYLIESFEWK